MLAKLFLAAMVTSSTAMAVSPWEDSTIKVDPVAEIKLLRELYESQSSLVKRTLSLYANGLSRSSDMVLATSAYFETASQLAWAEEKFEPSYRYTQLAVVVGEQTRAELEQSVLRGQVSIDVLLKAQRRVTEAKLVALRYEALAKEKGIELKPLEPMDSDELLKLLREELNMPEPPQRE